MSMDEQILVSTKDSHAVLCLQMERYREMSNEERLEIGLRMWEFARELIAASIQNESPGIRDSELRQKVLSRMQS